MSSDGSDESLYQKLMNAVHGLQEGARDLSRPGGFQRLGEATASTPGQIMKPVPRAEVAGLLGAFKPPTRSEIAQGSSSMSNVLQHGGSFNEAAKAIESGNLPAELPGSPSAPKSPISDLEHDVSPVAMRDYDEVDQRVAPTYNRVNDHHAGPTKPGVQQGWTSPEGMQFPDGPHFTPAMNADWMKSIGLDPAAKDQFYGQTPVGPARGIATLRGNTPGFVAFYSPEQKAAMAQQNINLQDIGQGFEWGPRNLALFQNQMANRALTNLHANQILGSNTAHEMDAKARQQLAQAKLEEERAKLDPARLQEQRFNFAVKADPSLLNRPDVAKKMGIPLTPDEEIAAATHARGAGGQPPPISLAEAAKFGVSPQVLMQSSLAPEIQRMIANIRRGEPAQGLGVLARLFGDNQSLAGMDKISRGISASPEELQPMLSELMKSYPGQ